MVKFGAQLGQKILENLEVTERTYPYKVAIYYIFINI